MEKPGQFFWCAAAGVALTCSFPGPGADWFAWLAPALLMVGLRSASPRRAAFLGLAAGLVHFLTLLYWLVPTMHSYAPMPLALSAGVLVLLAFYLALYMSVFSGLITWCSSGRLAHPLWCLLTVPVFWVGLEWFRGQLFTGFPWGLLGYSQYARLHLIQIADIAGIYGVSFLLAFVSACVFVLIMAITRLDWHGRAASAGYAFFAAAAAAVLIAAAAGYGEWRIEKTDSLAENSDRMRVAVIQGNIEQSLKWDDAFREETTSKYIRLTADVVEDSPDLVVWPETALPFYFSRDRELTLRVLNAVEQTGVYHLVGSPAYEYDSQGRGPFLFNSAYLIDPRGNAADRYDKVHLVPFGEYVPLRRWLPFLGKMVPQQGDFSAGATGQVLDMEGTGLGVQICYEMIFPGLSAAMTRQGGDLIVNITNDAWFGKTAAPAQHFSMGVFRAVENRRAFVRSANTGISGFIDPSGRIEMASEIFETRTLVGDVALIKDRPTFYSRHGDFLPWACMAAMACFILAGLRKGLRMSRNC
ncbi:MAG: apolipoprotein N-acyltransferase [Desulfosalsimonas sp.]